VSLPAAFLPCLSHADSTGAAFCSDCLCSIATALAAGSPTFSALASSPNATELDLNNLVELCAGEAVSCKLGPPSPPQHDHRQTVLPTCQELPSLLVDWTCPCTSNQTRVKGTSSSRQDCLSVHLTLVMLSEPSALEDYESPGSQARGQGLHTLVPLMQLAAVTRTPATPC
jgi:hypothetical protein